MLVHGSMKRLKRAVGHWSWNASLLWLTVFYSEAVSSRLRKSEIRAFLHDYDEEVLEQCFQPQFSLNDRARVQFNVTLSLLCIHEIDEAWPLAKILLQEAYKEAAMARQLTRLAAVVGFRTNKSEEFHSVIGELLSKCDQRDYARRSLYLCCALAVMAKDLPAKEPSDGELALLGESIKARYADFKNFNVRDLAIIGIFGHTKALS